MDLVDEFLEVSSSWRRIPGKIIQRRCAWLSQESARSIRWGGDAHASAVLLCVCAMSCALGIYSTLILVGGLE